MTLAAYYHDLDPFLFRISGDFGVRWYGLSYLLGFLIAYLVLRWLARRGAVLVPSDRVADAMMWLIAGTLIGGRLGYVLIYDPSLLTDWLPGPPWWGLLAINKGGMASHGGMVGLGVACWRISRGWKDPAGRVVGRCPVSHVMDATALVAPFGIFLGRIANFINGELLGRVHSPPGVDGPWWTVKFPQELLSGHRPEILTDPPRELVALVHRATPDAPFERGVRFLVEHATRYRADLEPLLSSRYPSQLFQAAAEGLVLGAVLWIVAIRPRKPGVLAGTFLVVYGALRILTEFWRLPDAQFAEGRPYGLSRGQWLSVAMVAGGLVWLVWAVRRAAPRFGGWLSGPSKPSTPA